ncbi:MAG: ABC transporter ATP-binding protein [Gemmatimonadota bacterium]
MIELRDLVFSYPDSEFGLSIAALEIASGTTVAFIGPSGSGKTTLLNLIAGILSPDTGSVRTNGTLLTELPDRARRAIRIRDIGLVFQEFELLEYLSVLDNILLPYRIHPTLKLEPDVERRARSLAARVGIEDKLRRRPGQLSQGERQRVAVCRAVITDPPLLLTDEPTGNLDPQNRETVLDILFDYVRDAGTTLVSVTHDHEILDRFEEVIDFRSFHSFGTMYGSGDRPAR